MVFEHMKKFEPSEFGLSGKYIGNGRGGRSAESKNKCYIINQNNGKERKTLNIVLSNSAGIKTMDNIGGTVDFDFDKDGVIYLWAGNSRRITKNSRSCSRFNIAVGSMYDDYTRKMGEFRRLYVKPEFCGNHVKLKPTGERDI